MQYFRDLKNGHPTALRQFHFWATVVWGAAAIPICLLLASSIPFLVFVSIYAVVTGHWSSWQAARVEERQEIDANVQDVLDVVQSDRS